MYKVTRDIAVIEKDGVMRVIELPEGSFVEKSIDPEFEAQMKRDFGEDVEIENVFLSEDAIAYLRNTFGAMTEGENVNAATFRAGDGFEPGDNRFTDAIINTPYAEEVKYEE